MTSTDKEIIVEDVDAPAEDSPSVTGTRSVDIIVSFLLLGIAALLGYDNWRSGAGWAPDGPQAGYFPFYLSLVLGSASIYGIVTAYVSRKEEGEAFVTRDQLRRVAQVFVPSFLFCLFTQWLGLYVASFIFIAGFMAWIGKIALWKSVLTALLFSLIMFATFEIAFDVIMPKGPLEALFGY